MAHKNATAKAAKGSEGLYKMFFEEVVRALPERSRDVLRRRFGIDPTAAHTLDGIGKHYGLTRERIRQIVESGIGEVRKATTKDLSKKIYAPLEKEVKKRGNIMPEADLVDLFARADDSERGAVKFFIEAADNINHLKRDDVFRTVVHVEFDEVQWERVGKVVRAILSDVKEPLAHEILHEQYRKHKDADTNIDHDLLHHFLNPLTDVRKNPFGRWGMAHWHDVTPRGIREKIYLILKEHGKPMHFREIAAKIDEHKLNKRPNAATNVQTVHNELIKDPRFILVGRGLYGLEEWGYVRGTVRDVIAKVLADNGGGPMSTARIVEEVMKARDVRKMTIVVNLNSFFRKTGRGMYALPTGGVAPRGRRKSVVRAV